MDNAEFDFAKEYSQVCEEVDRLRQEVKQARDAFNAVSARLRNARQRQHGLIIKQVFPHLY